MMRHMGLAYTLCLGLLLSTIARAGALEEVLEGYHGISGALAYDKLKDARERAVKLVPAAEALARELEPEKVVHGRKIIEGLNLLAATGEEEELRLRMETLSEGVVRLIATLPRVQPHWQLYFCPMAHRFKYWVQPLQESMANPYMGTKMLKCGVKKKWEGFPR